ncbi:hypothetical protein AB0G20_06390 [Streptomyces sp. NPDC024017]|uniref:hypothetical protein n=1 Tax=Streptomyces sp. NPDC024017 TaxID=3154326 RepID=UPI0033EA84A2
MATIFSSSLHVSRTGVFSSPTSSHSHQYFAVALSNDRIPRASPAESLARGPNGLGFDGDEKAVSLGRLDLEHRIHPALQRLDLRGVGREDLDGGLCGRRQIQCLEDGSENLRVVLEDPVRGLMG